jgi:cell division initiation protein
MDRIMPIDLDNAKLRKSFRGYNRNAVDDLLKETSRSLETLLAENAQLRDELDRHRAELQTYRTQENTLRDALLLAQRTADETRAVAHRQAEAVVEEARQAALAERMAVQQKVSEMRWELERLRQERQRFADDFRTLLDRHQRELASTVSLSIVEGEAVSA